MIKVISQSTSERRLEIQRNFEKVKPFLDNGLTYAKACFEAGLCTNHRNVSCYRWFKDLTKYGATQGYPYKDYKG